MSLTVSQPDGLQAKDSLRSVHEGGRPEAPDKMILVMASGSLMVNILQLYDT